MSVLERRLDTRATRRTAVALSAAALALLSACAADRPASMSADAADAAQASRALRSRAIPLPGANGVVHLDYLAVDRARGRVWIPAGNTGRVDVLDIGSGALTAIEGFPTAEVVLLGKRALAGPTAVTLSEDFAFVGNRGDGTICAIDARTLERGPCLAFARPGLEATADGLAYVAATREIWVTIGAPPLGVRSASPAVAVLDASNPRALVRKALVPLDGAAEGYAVDEAAGVFYTNLEDLNRTIAVDVRARRVTASWDPGCGPDGPRGLAVDSARKLVFVACTDGVAVLDARRGGVRLASAKTGGGVDNIDYVESRRELFVASAQAPTLSVFRVGDGGQLTLAGQGPTARFARVVVADASGRAYVADPAGGRILAFEPVR